MASQSRLQVLYRVPRYLGAAREGVMKAGRRCILGAVLVKMDVKWRPCGQLGVESVFLVQWTEGSSDHSNTDSG
jgi:hypothetical protein